MQAGLYARRKRQLTFMNIFFMPVLHLTAFVALPLYAWKNGVTAAEIVIFLFFFIATSFSITVGYHRFFAHTTFKTGRVLEFLLLFFGAATYEGSALRWASLHRRHHRFTDTEDDPYNINLGFFYAHMGWFMFWWQKHDYDNVKDLQKSALVMHQHKHYQAWAFVSSLALPVLLGFAAGRPLGVFLWAIALRMCLVMHSAFFINSFAHRFGSQPYDRTVSARDNWLGAVLTNGEGYHNFHHTFPFDYRNGIRWFHWDPTKWAIWLLSKLGVARELRKTPEALIRSTRASGASAATHALAEAL